MQTLAPRAPLLQEYTDATGPTVNRARMSGIVIDGVGASDSNHCSASPRLHPTSTNECEGRVPATSPFCLSTRLSQPTYVYQSEMPATSGHGTVMGTYVDASM